MYEKRVSKQTKDSEKEVEIFEPVLGELIADDNFSFTLLSCHCSKS